MMNILTMIGCIMYLIPNSPVFVLIGRFFIGFNILTTPLMFGEFARSYKKEQFEHMLLILRGVHVFGKAVGPVFIIFFLNTNYYIDTIHVGYDNISAVIIFVLVVLAQVLFYFVATDLSKEYDRKKEQLNDSCLKEDMIQELKEDTAKNLNSDKSIKEHEIKRKSVIQLYKFILKDRDVFFIMLSSFWHWVIVQMIILVIPVIILENLHYYKSTVNIVMAAQLFSFCLMLLVLYFFKFKQVTSGLYSWILTIASLAVTIIVSPKLSFTLNVILLVVVQTLVEVALLKMNVFLSSILASLVQSKYQSFMESIRFTIYQTGAIVGSLIAAGSIVFLTEVYGTFIVISVIFFIMTLFKRNSLLENKIRI